MRKYDIENYLDDLNDDDVCYWLGFIFADGNVYRNKLRVALSAKDLTHLEKLRDFISPNRPLYYRKSNNSYKSSK